jgi:hypothetical protein
MGELKTKITDQSVEDFLERIKDEGKRKDAFALLTMLKKITKEEPRLWGNGTIGFGVFTYKSARSAQQGEWYLAGFSPRAANLTIYIMPGFGNYKSLLGKLGKFKTGGGCLYLNKLADVDVKILGELMETGYRDIKKMIVDNKSVFGQTSLGSKPASAKNSAEKTRAKPAKKAAEKTKAIPVTKTKTKTVSRKATKKKK